MVKMLPVGLILVVVVFAQMLMAQNNGAHNPIIFADVPDISIVRVGKSYYMSSTTMHLSPGVPVMKSDDLVNWEIISYAYDTLANVDALNLANAESAYGRGSWASSLRHHNDTWYVSTFAQTTGKTYIFYTKDVENGPWKEASFAPSLHDNTLFFDEDGRVYMIYGNGRLYIVELKPDLSGLIEGTQRVLIDNASAPAGENIMLGAEGSQLFKVGGMYYLFNIVWPRGGMRTVLVYRAEKITGPYQGRVALQDKGVAQGGLIDTPDGTWYSYLFRDYGAVGRIPYLVPVQWKEGWPILGINGKVPDTLPALPMNHGPVPGIVASDDFERTPGEQELPLMWQWNHNPVDSLWSVHDRKGWLRLTTGRTDTSFLMARNTLTQRTFGPACSGSVCIDVSAMNEGDFAGLALLQKKYGQAGVKFENGKKSIVMIEASAEQASTPLNQDLVYLKADCNFKDREDMARFFYSLDGKSWIPIGSNLKMEYTIPHFMGYRYALFHYATKKAGGYTDFDWFKIQSLK